MRRTVIEESVAAPLRETRSTKTFKYLYALFISFTDPSGAREQYHQDVHRQRETSYIWRLFAPQQMA